MSKQLKLDGTEPTTRVGHCKHCNHDVYIGRADNGDSHMLNTDIHNRGWLGKPFTVDDRGRAQCIEAFRIEFEKRIEDDLEFRGAIADLKGSILGCWCQRLSDDGPACHGEVIAEWADRLGGNHE